MKYVFYTKFGEEFLQNNQILYLQEIKHKI